MPAPDPYVTFADLQAQCSYIDQMGAGDDEFLTQRVSARRWFDAAVMAAVGSSEAIEIVVDDQVVKANVFKALAEILFNQITPMISENAYQGAAARFASMAESEISTMVVEVVTSGAATSRVYLGVSRRG